MNAWRRFHSLPAWLPVVLLSLGACAVPSDIDLTSVAIECPKVSEKALKMVNWTQVPEVDLRIRHDEFEPMVLRLRQGWPYVFRIRNRDDYAHNFKANEFFSKVAVIDLTIGGIEKQATCFGTIRIPARQTVELRLIALVDGFYEYEDTWIPLPYLFSTGTDGVIIIEERKARI